MYCVHTVEEVLQVMHKDRRYDSTLKLEAFINDYWPTWCVVRFLVKNGTELPVKAIVKRISLAHVLQPQIRRMFDEIGDAK